MNEKQAAKFLLLEELLAGQNMQLQPMYTNHDAAKIFKVDVRTIQNWIAAGRLLARDLPGRWRFMSQDLEDFVRSSRKEPRKRPLHSIEMAA